MKTLSLNRPLILMIVGLPGAGKSFFARQFAETFGVPMVSADRLRHELFAAPTFSKDEQAIIDRLADYQIGELAKTKRSFIVDGRYNNRADRLTAEKLAEAHDYGTLIIWVQTDEPTAKIRATKRKPGRADDAQTHSLTLEQFTVFAKHLSAPQRESYVVISGKHAYSTQAKMVLRKLAAPHAKQAGQLQKPAARPTPSASPRSRVLIR